MSERGNGNGGKPKANIVTQDDSRVFVQLSIGSVIEVKVLYSYKRVGKVLPC